METNQKETYKLGLISKLNLTKSKKYIILIILLIVIGFFVFFNLQNNQPFKGIVEKSAVSGEEKSLIVKTYFDFEKIIKENNKDLFVDYLIKSYPAYADDIKKEYQGIEPSYFKTICYNLETELGYEYIKKENFYDNSTDWVIDENKVLVYLSFYDKDEISRNFTLEFRKENGIWYFELESYMEI